MLQETAWGNKPHRGKESVKMVGKRSKLSGWLYGLGLVPVLGCLVAMVLVYRWFPGLPGTLDARMDLDNLTRVVVPGSEQITFDKRGAYAVYYEYRSVVDGVTFASSVKPPELACSLTSRTSGTELHAAPDYVPTNRYATKDRERVGVLSHSITVDEPGAYTFSCRYPDGRSQPEVVMAVGPNLVWEFFGVAAKTVLTAGAGLAALLCTGPATILIVFAVAARRRKPELATASS
jgi:hypothetical protein